MKNIGLFLTILLFPSMVFATGVTATPAAMPDVTPAPPVQYELPYPGMLPNNPLYFLKQARDWILDKLITDPVKKTEFYILQADKRLAMGRILSAGGNDVLAEQTMSKGEKYMNNAMQALFALKAQGRDVPVYIMDHITQALAKHAEVLTEETAKTTDAVLKSGFAGSLDLVNTLRGELPKLQ
jgi:hypothetical protein